LSVKKNKAYANNVEFGNCDGQIRRAGGNVVEFKDEDELKKYVTDELRKALPKGWVANMRLQHRYLDKHTEQVDICHLEWKIYRKRSPI